MWKTFRHLMFLGLPRCLVDFADGDHLAVRLWDVIIVDRFSIGQSVLVESTDGGYDPGLVIGYYGRGTNSGYTVETDDGVTNRYVGLFPKVTSGKR